MPRRIPRVFGVPKDRQERPERHGEGLIDLNAMAVAIRAGYKDGNIGRQLITKNNVAEAIAAAQSARSERTEITVDRGLKELSKT